MQRKLRMGMVGGGQGSMIGEVHRLAAGLTGRIELVAGAFSSSRQKSYDSGKDLGLPVARVYGSYRDMFKKEAKMDEGDRIDFVAITAPNNMHYPISMAALDAGFPILCDKPMTTTLDEGLNLRRKLLEKQLRFGLTFSYTGYPMVREARELVRQGRLGEIRKIVMEYPQGWLATRLETAGNKQAGWRTDPRRCGPSGAVADIGTHALEVVQFITSLGVVDVCADLRAFVPGRQLEDDGTVMMHFSNGAHGLLWASQICAGEINGLRIRLYGDKGGLVWEQERPNTLLVHAVNGHSEIRRAADPTLSAAAQEATWMPAGFPDGFLEAFANLYDAFADDLTAALAGKPIPAQLLYPSLVEGLRSVSFVDAVMRNMNPESSEKWTKLTAT